MQEQVDRFKVAICAAAEHSRPLQIRGGGSKDFYGNPVHGVDCDTLDVTSYRGVVDYEPAELVVTVCAGTALAELEAILKQQGQMLAFEPPHYGPAATLGGCVAAGISGPRRPFAGAVRDFVLGVRMLDGRGNDLRFGGRVMKNVAGYDVSRLMAGSMGTLGVLLDVSLKVLPLPYADLTLRMQMTDVQAIEQMNHWAGRPLPITATCYCAGDLVVRLSGSEPVLRAVYAKLGGETVVGSDAFWESVREQTHQFFHTDEPIWRLSVKSTAPPLDLPGRQMIEWNGALRWFINDQSVDEKDIHAIAAAAGGHATLFRNHKKNNGAFYPLNANMMRLHRLIKHKFDPSGIFNPNRLYPGL